MGIQLDRPQKIAFARVMSDLIEADFIVEEREMAFFKNIISKNGLNIKESMLVEAKKRTLAQAILTLKELDKKGRAEIVTHLKTLALSDGTCVPMEAALIFALEQALEHDAQIYSVPARDIGINNMQVIYIENENKTATAKAIEKNFRSISNELALAGFDFIHIPFIVDDFKSMSSCYLTDVVRYMIPSASQEKINSICYDLQNMTTSRFCRDLLYKKIKLPLSDVAPSLLIKICDSACIVPYSNADTERINYANFIRIELDGDVMATIRRIADAYHSMVNCPITVNRMPYNHRFMYYGFHRSLFDLIAYTKEQKEYNLVFDLIGKRAEVCFEPTDRSGERIILKLTPQEIALYLLIVRKSLSSRGLDWREKDMPDETRKSILAEYNEIYSLTSNGNKAANYKDRTHVNHIRVSIKANRCIANMESFLPQLVRDGKSTFLKISASPNQIRIVQ